jgi:hypothetical protein
VTLEHIVATVTLVHIVAAVTLDHIVAEVTLYRVATMFLDTVVAYDTIVVSVIPLVAQLMSLPETWHKEHLWNFPVLQRV